MRKSTIALVCALWSTLSLAGVVIQVETRDLPDKKPATVDTMYADGTMLRVEPGAGGVVKDLTILFRDNALWLLNDRERTYSRLDDASIEAMSGQLNAAMKAMQERMAKLPPEQRAMMEKMMPGKLPGMREKPEIRVERKGSEKVGDYDCARYEVFENGEKASEVLTADVSAVAGASDAIQAMRAMAEFGRRVAEAMPAGPLSGLADGPLLMLDQMDGFPILTRLYDEGEVIQEVELKSIVPRKLDAALFSPPDGYKETKLMGGGTR